MPGPVLLVSSHLPYPGVLHGGGARVWRLLRALAERTRVDVVSYYRREEEGEIGKLRGICAEVEALPLETNVLWTLPPGWVGKACHFFWPPQPDDVLVYRSPALREALRRRTAAVRYRAAFVEFPEMGLALEDLPPHCLRVHDTIEVRSATRWRDFAAEKRPLWKAYYLSQYLKACWFERSTYPLYDLVLTVSEADRARVAPYLRPEQALTVPIGLFLEEYPYRGMRGRRPDTLLFVASFRNSANVEGLLWFCRQVLPRVRSRVPGCLLKVAASNLTPEISALQESGKVEIVGPFSDLREVSWEARVSIAPIRLGGGMKTKIPEAMAFGLPVVATPQAAEGIGPNEALLVAGDEAGFAGHVLHLLADDDFAQRHSRLGRALAEERFDFRKNMQPLFQMLDKAPA